MEKIIDLHYNASTVPLFWGPPGSGKTATIEAYARKKGAVLIAPTIKTPEDIVVVSPPRSSDDYPLLKPIGDFAKAIKLANAGKEVIIFIDELTTCPPTVQAAILRFLDSGVLAGERLGNDIWRCAAANPSDQAAGGFELELPVTNRLCHENWTVDARDWAINFPSYWGNPPKYPRLSEEYWFQARQIVAEYIIVNPTQLIQPPNNNNILAWPSCRSWDAASRLLAAAKLDIDAVIERISNTVGDGAAVSFHEYVKNRDLIDPESILEDPQCAKVPERQDKILTTCFAVANAVVNKFSTRRWKNAWLYFCKVGTHAAKDLVAPAVVVLKPLIIKHPDIPKEVGEVFKDLAYGPEANGES